MCSHCVTPQIRRPFARHNTGNLVRFRRALTVALTAWVCIAILSTSVCTPPRSGDIIQHALRFAPVPSIDGFPLFAFAQPNLTQGRGVSFVALCNLLTRTKQQARADCSSKPNHWLATPRLIDIPHVLAAMLVCNVPINTCAIGTDTAAGAARPPKRYS